MDASSFDTRLRDLLDMQIVLSRCANTALGSRERPLEEMCIEFEEARRKFKADFDKEVTTSAGYARMEAMSVLIVDLRAELLDKEVALRTAEARMAEYEVTVVEMSRAMGSSGEDDWHGDSAFCDDAQARLAALMSERDALRAELDKEAALRAELTAKVQQLPKRKAVVCTTCEGSGDVFEDVRKRSFKTCPDCLGSGAIIVDGE